MKNISLMLNNITYPENRLDIYLEPAVYKVSVKNPFFNRMQTKV